MIAILTAALALSASVGAQPAGPKADHIAFMSMKRTARLDIYTMDAAGFTQVNLTHDQTIGSRTDSEPAWSPNGQWVAFQRAFSTVRNRWHLAVRGQFVRERDARPDAYRPISQ